MAEKILNTRIQLRYDTYANWTSANPELKKGEIAVATLATDVEINHPELGKNANQHPILFKVGTGSHKFNELPWASALAADVYDWAKKPSLDENDLPAIPGAKLGLTVTVTGDGNAVTDASWNAETKTITLTKGKTFSVDGHKHVAEDITDFSDEVKAVVNTMGLGTNDTIVSIDERLTEAEAEIDALQTAVETTLPGQIATKVAQADYDVQVAALE